MRFERIICCWWMATAGVVAASPPLIDDDALQSAGMTRFWTAKLPIGQTDALKAGFLVDDALYVATANGSLFALVAEVGLVRWADKLTAADYTIFHPSHVRTADDRGPTLIATTTTTFLYDRYSGDLIRSFAPEFATGGPALGYQVGGLARLFMGSVDGRFYSLTLSGAGGPAPFKAWEVLTSGPLTTRPLLYGDGMLLFASQDGRAYSCRAADKALNWVFPTTGPILGDPAVDDSGAYIASTDRSVYKVDLETGARRWRCRMPQPLTEGPVVAGGIVFQHCTGNGVSAIDAGNGEEKWRIENGRAFVAHASAGDFIFTSRSQLLRVDHATGEIASTIDAGSVIATVTNTHDDAVYALGQGGRVLCARTDKTPYLRRQQVMAARARLNRPPADENEKDRNKKPQYPKEPDPIGKDPFRSRWDDKP